MRHTKGGLLNPRDQETNEPSDAYVTALRKLANTCIYGALTDSLIRERMVIGIEDNYAQKELAPTDQ